MKKVLSWVLALALVLSSFAISFAGDTENASKLKDADQITYTEAVDVMVATGVIAGYPDGYYYPAKAVKRAEMAKMIAVLVNGGEDVGDYYKDACKFADSKNHWAAGYIAYCANEGIIDGRDANTFDPEANVTVTEAAKMLLVALGYDSKIEGYANNANWAGNILKRAKANDLFDGIEKLDTGAAANREVAAQIIFNAMQATMVDYDFDTTITVGGTDVSITTKVENVTATEKQDTNDDGLLQLFEDAFGGDLVNNADEPDAFGRPAHTWNYDKKDIGTYGDTADYTFVVSDAADTTLAAALETWTDGWTDDNITISTKSQVNGYTSSGTGMNGMGVAKGDIIELFDLDYVKEGKNAYAAISTRYSLEQITDVDTDVTAAHEKDGVSAYVTVGEVTVNDTDFVGFDAKTYVEDAFVAVVIKGDEVIASFVPETKEGDVTKYVGTASAPTAIYLDGTKYETVANVAVLDADAAVDNLEVEQTVALYIDANGYVIGSVLVEDTATHAYGLVVDEGEDNDGWSTSSAVNQVKVLGADGKTTVYSAGADFTDDSVITTAGFNSTASDATNAAAAYLIDYTLDEDGNLDTAAAATGSWTSNKTVSAKGIVAGKILSEDVVAYYYDTVEEEWMVYGYNDLLEATFQGSYITVDGDVAYILMTQGTFTGGSSSQIFGFYVDSTAYNIADGKVYHEITMMVNGAEKTYETVADRTPVFNDTAYGGADAMWLFVANVNADGKIKDIELADAVQQDEPKASITAKAVGIYNATSKTISEKVKPDFKKITAVSGSNVDIDGDASEVGYISVAGATVYKLTLDGTAPDKLTKYTGNMRADGYAVLLQMDEDTEAWDTVIYITPADWTAYQEALK